MCAASLFDGPAAGLGGQAATTTRFHRGTDMSHSHPASALFALCLALAAATAACKSAPGAGPSSGGGAAPAAGR